MPEGLSPAEVGKEIAEHNKHSHADGRGHDRRLSIVEALLLSFVAVLAAYSGYAAAKWGTESSLTLARASAERTKANRADTEAIVTRTLDSASFNAWFSAFIAGDANAQRLAEKRMRPVSIAETRPSDVRTVWVSPKDATTRPGTRDGSEPASTTSGLQP